MQPVDPSLCVIRVLALAPAEAEAALAACEAHLAGTAPARHGRFRITLPGGTAELRPAPLLGASRGSRRRLAGVVRSRWRFRSVPVELEVGPWSERQAELRVRPIGSLCLRSRSHHRLFTRLGPTLAESVGFEVELDGVAHGRPPAAVGA